MKKEGRFSEKEKIEHILQHIYYISTDTPELNMGNYSEDQVEKLNNAMLEIWKICDTYFKK